MKTRCSLIFSIALVILLALTACIPLWSGPGSAPYQQPYGPGGMMGPGGMGGGMMGSSGGMMGGQGGMMGGMGGTYNPNARPISIDQAANAAKLYINAYGGDLELKEVMEFAWNFYAEVEEKSTGVHAMELLVDKYTGQVSPEMGPNMMWNAKYGMMASYGVTAAPTANMPVKAPQAKELARQFLNTNLPGVTVDEADTFYGYYTLHTMKGGQIEGMLSVNGYTGAVWYHTWHGPFITMKELD
ncbi:MAG: hypothetical protein HY667_00385 [Chloroflexi bacterium]|nr:hypothetical protein [Chloroflexota bacterium]